MEIKTIQDLISNNSPRVSNISIQKRYAGGYNASILDRAAHEEPDNRIPTPIARKGIRFLSGYMAKPGNIIYSDDESYVEDILQPIFDENDEQLKTQEELETAATHGCAWEYHFTINGTPHFEEVPVDQCIPIWNNELPKKLVGMIRYYKEKDENGKDICEAYYYDELSIQEYSGDNFSMLQPEGGPELHGYGEVPFAQAKIARDESNLFDCVRPIIDIHDRIISEDYANEGQRFANSYLLLRNRLGNEIDEMGLNEVDKIRITRTFEDLGENVSQAVAFLEKNIPTDFMKTIQETFERLAYDMMQIINPNEIATTGQISGISLAYKLLQFEYFCASCEAYFSRFLQWRIRLIQNIQGMLSADDAKRPQVDIQFRRNLPFDMQAAVDQFTKLSGKELPTEIALKVFPADFIPDPAKTAEDMNGGSELFQGGDTSMPMGENVQAQALNGAQVASIVQVAQAVADNQLPLATAVEIVLVSVPTMSRDDAMRMLKPADDFTPDKPIQTPSSNAFGQKAPIIAKP